MSLQSIQDAITEGFSVAKRSFGVFLVYFLFNGLMYIHLKEFMDQVVYVLIYIPIYLGFLLAVPLLLDKSRRNVLTARDVASDTFRSSIRLIVPLALLFVVFVLPFALAFRNNPSFLREVVYEVQRQQDNPTLTDILLPAIIVSLLNFTSCYFALEKRNLFSAAAKSVSTIIRYPLYLIFVMIIFQFQTFIKEYLLFDSILANILFMIPTAYFFALISSIDLVYFQDVIQKPESGNHQLQNPLIRWVYTSSPLRNMLVVLVLLTAFYFLFYQSTGL